MADTVVGQQTGLPELARANGQWPLLLQHRLATGQLTVTASLSTVLWPVH